MHDPIAGIRACLQQFLPDRRAVHPETAAEVRLRQHPTGVDAGLSRGRPDSAFEAECDCVRARAYSTFLRGSIPGVPDRRQWFWPPAD
jgi:hypothetical protein